MSVELINGNDLHCRELLLKAVDDRRIDGASGSSNLWSFALDIECNFGGAPSIKNLFEKCLRSKSATQKHILAYAKFLEDNNQDDELFRVYERGILLSGWPTCANLWIRYLYKFIDKYKGTRRERTRDLFEDCLKDAPENESMPIFILYAKFEEDYGLYSQAMNIYRRAVEIIDNDDIIDVWLASACRLYGVAKTREVYEYAIHHFKDIRAAEWSSRYAELETKLTEYERARVIYIHGGQFADPEKYNKYWEKFENFEKLYGTKETYKEMLSQKKLAITRFNRTANTDEIEKVSNEDEEREIEEVNAAQIVMNDELKISETIYDQGTFTGLERLEKKKKLKRI